MIKDRLKYESKSMIHLLLPTRDTSSQQRYMEADSERIEKNISRQWERKKELI